MQISVVITTRNRPDLLRRALASVMAQRSALFEIVLVDDGSAPAHDAALAELARSLGSQGTLHRLPPAPGGHGPGFTRNHGVALATGDYITFLDDDDEWTDPDYLAAVASAVTGGADLHYANQEAIRPDGSRIDHVVWIEDLTAILSRTLQPRPDGIFAAPPAQLLQSQGFCHLNATAVRRQFFLDLGGFDVSLRYEEDRDFHLRAIDAAETILYNPRVVARHYVPERGTASTSLSPDQRSLDQLRVLDKAIMRASRPDVRAYAKRFKAYTLKAIAQRHHRAGNAELAGFYAGEALGIGFNAKWLAFALWLRLRGGRVTRAAARSPGPCNPPPG